MTFPIPTPETPFEQPLLGSIDAACNDESFILNVFADIMKKILLEASELSFI